MFRFKILPSKSLFSNLQAAFATSICVFTLSIFFCISSKEASITVFLHSSGKLYSIIEIFSVIASKSFLQAFNTLSLADEHPQSNKQPIKTSDRLGSDISHPSQFRIYIVLIYNTLSYHLLSKGKCLKANQFLP